MRCAVVLVALVASLLVTPAFAQSATVAIFNAAATNPNTAKPLATPVVYGAPLCNQPFANEPSPIVDPIIGYYLDPNLPTTRNCQVDVTAQIRALPVGSGYKGAVKVGTGLYGEFSTGFRRDGRAGDARV